MFQRDLLDTYLSGTCVDLSYHRFLRWMIPLSGWILSQVLIVAIGRVFNSTQRNCMTQGYTPLTEWLRIKTRPSPSAPALQPLGNLATVKIFRPVVGIGILLGGFRTLGDHQFEQRYRHDRRTPRPRGWRRQLAHGTSFGLLGRTAPKCSHFPFPSSRLCVTHTYRLV